MKSGNHNFLEPSGPLQACYGTALSILVLPNFFFSLAGPFWLRIITADSHILGCLNIECLDDRYRKLKIYISEIILDNHEIIPIAYVIMTLIKLSLTSWVPGFLS